MKYLFTLSVTILLTACGGSSSQQEPIVTPPPISSSIINKSASFTYTLTTDVKYGEGLTHSDWNAPEPTSMDLLLDIYEPDNDFQSRPAVVFIHGGGFTGGSKSAASAFTMMSYFAERGFVGFSINYRVLGDYGTIPDEVNLLVGTLPDVSDYQRDQVRAMYPAGRDAKAAIRWLYANADTYGVDTNSISVIGGSAGSYIALGLGVTEPQDYRDELSITEDSTLSSTNLEQSSMVHTVIDHWGGTGLVDIINLTYEVNRWDSTDAPISIIHGTDDPTVPFSEAIAIRDQYELTGVPYAYYPIEGGGHGIWGVTVDGIGLTELALNFIVDSQGLTIGD